MSRIGGNPVKSPQDEIYLVCGRILGGAGVASIQAGKGFSLTYVSAGRYRITPDVNFPQFAGAVATLYQAGPSFFNVKGLAYVSQGGAGTTASIDFLVTNAGAPADMGAADELWFHIAFGRSVKA